MFAYREYCARIEISGTPFAVLPHVIGFSCDVRNEVVRTEREGTLERQLISIAPVEFPILPVEIRTVPIRHYQSCLQGKVSGQHRFYAICGRLIRRGEVAIAGFENQGSRFGIVQIKFRYLLQSENLLQIQLHAWADT